MTQTLYFDVLIIGSGAAGLSAALNLPSTCQVAIVSKGRINDGSTWWAQGGIAAVLDDEDTIEQHVKDTLKSGAGLCHAETVEYTVRNSRPAIDWLIDQGVQFTREQDDQDKYHLTKEGGHSQRRIIHSADATGVAVHSALIKKVESSNNITVLTDHIAIDLVTQADSDSTKYRCTGAYIYSLGDDQVNLYQAKAVVLATGGASKVYL